MRVPLSSIPGVELHLLEQEPPSPLPGAKPHIYGAWAQLPDGRRWQIRNVRPVSGDWCNDDTLGYFKDGEPMVAYIDIDGELTDSSAQIRISGLDIRRTNGDGIFHKNDRVPDAEVVTLLRTIHLP